MRIVIQRVSKASVTIYGEVVAQIGAGFLIFLGIEVNDKPSDVDYLIAKVIGLRVFGDRDGKMNISINQINGSCLIISQFTLHASTKKGNRPSFIKAAKPDVAIPLYEYFIEKLDHEIDGEVFTGKFGEDMKVALVNDGPVTIIIDSKNKE